MKGFLWLDALAIWGLGGKEVAALEHLMEQVSDAERRDELVYLARTRSIA